MTNSRDLPLYGIKNVQNPIAAPSGLEESWRSWQWQYLKEDHDEAVRACEALEAVLA